MVPLLDLMPYKDANAIMLQMREEMLPVLQNGTPLLAGVCGTPPFRRMDRQLRQGKDLGFAGVQNFPTVGLIDGVFRQNIKETGMSYQNEVDMITLAHEMGLLTTPYVFSPEDAVKMTAAGADVGVAHMGLTTSGSIGASTALTLDQCVIKRQAIVDAATSVNPDILVLLHGGPILQRRSVHSKQRLRHTCFLWSIFHGETTRGNCH
jgi:predicted TIM-barrel enzyme